MIDAAGYFSASIDELYSPEFAESLRSGTLAADYPDLNALFDLNNPGFVQNDVPALIIQGDQDATIPLPEHEAFVEQYCAAGNRLTDEVLPGLNHFRARELSYRDVLAWMDAVTSGETVADVCAD